jgi:hypothetical protein
MALRYADYGYILENGRIVMDGEAKALRENEDVKEFYLGMGGGDRKSFRDVKSYKRRKRWLLRAARQARRWNCTVEGAVHRRAAETPLSNNAGMGPPFVQSAPTSASWWTK